ncbi:MAG: hypothetical protein ACT4P0_10640 [Panacagrimonas sp.]
MRWLGVDFEFDLDALTRRWQLADPELLRTDLLATVWYTHSQPPLLNLALGAMLKWVPPNYLEMFGGVLFSIFSFLTCAFILALLGEVGVPRTVALPAAMIFSISPALIAYENYLFTTLPCTALFTALCWGIVRIARDPSGPGAAVVCIAATLLCLTRSSYHLIFLLGIVGFVGYRAGWRKGLLLGFVPVMLVVGLNVKNKILFDYFGSSSWMGMNAYRTILPMPESARRCAAEATGDSVALQLPFLPVNDYLLAIPPMDIQSPYDHPVLSSHYKAGREGYEPYNNHNHWAYIQLSNRYKMAFIGAVKCSPLDYAWTVTKAYILMTLPAEEYSHVAFARAPIETYALWYDRLILLSSGLAYPAYEGFQARVPYDSGLTVIVFSIGGLAGWCALLLGRGKTLTAGWNPLALWVVLTLIAGHTVVSNFLEFSENNRIRFEWEPMMFVVILSVIAAWVRRARQAVREPGADQPAIPRVALPSHGRTEFGSGESIAAPSPPRIAA